MTCEASIGVCSKWYGRDLARGHLVHRGEAVGVVAAQSIGEPGTQLTMRTFHIGGAASSASEDNAIFNKNAGVVSFSDDIKTVTNKDKLEVVVSRNAMATITESSGKIIEQYKIPYGATIEVKDKAELNAGVKIASWDPYTRPIIAEVSGKVKFVDIEDGVTVREQMDELTGLSSIEIIEVSDRPTAGRDMSPKALIQDSKGKTLLMGEFKAPAEYPLPAGGLVNIANGQKINAGEVIARMPLVASKTKDITGGLPRVADIFESRKPKNPAVLAEISGIIEFGKDIKSKRRIIINPEDGDPVEYLIPKGTYIYFNEGDKVNKGDMIVDGTPAPTDILNILGIEALAEYMVREVQKVYRLQGVIIDDKHIECITKQMLQKVEVIESGDSEFPVGDVVDKTDVLQRNLELKEAGKKEAKFKMMILGITKASLQTNSFISAASFQETTRVLTEAAINGKVDKLTGLKENVIVGKLIPAGTGNVIRALRKEAKIRDNSLLKQIENTK
jgi:DNA-directed RNA polymerase subunit beta'